MWKRHNKFPFFFYKRDKLGKLFNQIVFQKSISQSVLTPNFVCICCVLEMFLRSFKWSFWFMSVNLAICLYLNLAEILKSLTQFLENKRSFEYPTSFPASLILPHPRSPQGAVRWETLGTPTSSHRSNLKSQQSSVISDSCLKKTLSGKSHVHLDLIVF